MLYVLGLVCHVGAIGIEALISWRRRLGLYRLGPSLSHWSAVIGLQALGPLVYLAIAAAYESAFAAARGWPVVGSWGLDVRSPVHWVAAILGIDLLAYGIHRLSHRVNLFAAFHAVHHQTEDFNHLSSMRHHFVVRFVVAAFYLPLALLGVPLAMTIACFYLISLFQLFAHHGITTRRLPAAIEAVLITPRNHRVHHGFEPPYASRNFGGIFTFWDRIFGTYRELDDAIPCRLGWNRGGGYPLDILQANWRPFADVGAAMRARAGLRAKLGVLLAAPEDLPIAPPRREVALSPRVSLLWTGLGTAIMIVVMATATDFGIGAQALLALMAFTSLYGLGRQLG